jgi:hypothetical protein
MTGTTRILRTPTIVAGVLGVGLAANDPVFWVEVLGSADARGRSARPEAG